MDDEPFLGILLRALVLRSPVMLFKICEIAGETSVLMTSESVLACLQVHLEMRNFYWFALHPHFGLED
jgi:hypothetical protein